MALPEAQGGRRSRRRGPAAFGYPPCPTVPPAELVAVPVPVGVQLRSPPSPLAVPLRAMVTSPPVRVRVDVVISTVIAIVVAVPPTVTEIISVQVWPGTEVAIVPATVYSMEHITSVADQSALMWVSSTLTMVIASPVKSTVGMPERLHI